MQSGAQASHCVSDCIRRLEWRVDLKAGEKRDLPFRFTVARPEDVVVVGL